MSTHAWMIAALGGLVVGSFLNVVIHRLPRMLERQWQLDLQDDLQIDTREDLRDISRDDLRDGSPGDSQHGRGADPARYNLWTPRSHCPGCQARLAWHQLIPVLSWLVLKGRCAACHGPIALRYPLVELTAAVLAVAVAREFGFTAAGAGAILLVWTLLALALIDLDTQLLPDDLTLPLLWLGLAFNLWEVHAALPDAVLGAMLGYGVLWAVYWVYRGLTGREGMGYGDFKLLAALGAWLGWQALPALVVLAAGAGALVGGILIATGRLRREVPIPFGPYLAGAGVLVLFFRGLLTP